jgi:hypothetical protein
MLGKMDAMEFLGLAKILCVHAFDNENKDENGKPAPRPAEEIIEDCIIAFDNLNRKQRREILRVMRAAVKGK